MGTEHEETGPLSASPLAKHAMSGLVFGGRTSPTASTPVRPKMLEARTNPPLNGGT